MRLRLRGRLDPNRLERGGIANPSSTGFKLQQALLRRFVLEVRAAGARPVVVILPDRASLGRSIAGRPGTQSPFVDSLAADGTDVIDLTDVLVEAVRTGATADSIFTAGLHYTPSASARIADWLIPRLAVLAASSADSTR